MPSLRRRLAAIMFTDMVGYSALTQADEAAALTVLERHNRILRSTFGRFQGTEVKTVGDAFLVEFASALDAVRCALEVQRTLREYNLSERPEWQIRIRIGIHVGDVVQTGSDVLGDCVNIASRIVPLAEPGGICISQQVYDQVYNKVEMSMTRLPPSVLKNIRTPVAVYRWVPSGESPTLPLPRIGAEVGHHLAVLPLANISPDPSDEYFADGLTEELISVLSHVPGLSVIARTSVIPYKTASKSIAQVGSELGVQTVLEGSVRKAGNRLRITLQLVDVGSQHHIWANSYNREIDDVFAVQTDIAERTAAALQIQLNRPSHRTDPGRPTANPAAYDAYLRGLVLASGPHGTRIDEAVRCFAEATRLDPGFAEAFAVWANLYVVVAGDDLPMREVMPKARDLAARALSLDPDSSDAHVALGNIAFQFDLDWGRAQAEFARALALNPSNVTAYRFLGLVLLALERYDEAKEHLRRAVRLDPGGGPRDTLSYVELLAGDTDLALAHVDDQVAQEPASIRRHVTRGFYYRFAGRLDEARKEADFPVAGADEEVRFDHALLNALVGRPDAARALIQEIDGGRTKSYISATHLAMLCSAVGERQRALDLLEQDFREGDRVLWLWYRGNFFDGIRRDPRFIALLRQYGVPTIGATSGESY